MAGDYRKRKMRRSDGKWSNRKALFAREYVRDMNGAQAAIRAGYSARTANTTASRLLAEDKVQKAIADAKSERLKRVDLSADKVIRELARIGLSDIRKIFDADGNPRPVAELDDDAAACIAGIEVVTRAVGTDAEGVPIVERVHKFRLWDKPSALEKLAKHMDLVHETLRLVGAEGGPVQHEHSVSLDLTTLPDDALDKLAAVAASLTSGRSDA